MPKVHPTAIVAAESLPGLADDCEIGPWCVVSGPVKLGRGVKLIGNVYLTGPIEVGDRTVVYPFACLGFGPQDVKFQPGMATPGVVIGADCTLREYVSIHAASKPDGPTRVGDRAFMLAGSHIGHDCVVGNDLTMVNGAALAGHCTIGDNVLLSGQAAIHQFCRVGRYVMISGDTAIAADVPPFCTINERNRIGGINRVGLRRAGFPRHHITALMEAYRLVLRNPTPNPLAVVKLREMAAQMDAPPLLEMAEFIAGTKRGICPGMGRPPRLKDTRPVEDALDATA